MAKLITTCRRFAIWTLILTGLGLFAAVHFSAQAQANIYDPQVEKYVKPTASQRGQVRKILRANDKEVSAIFKKYGINPNARPTFSKLLEASSELLAAQARERAALSKVLTPAQMQQYDRAIQLTRTRVRKAAQ